MRSQWWLALLFLTALLEGPRVRAETAPGSIIAEVVNLRTEQGWAVCGLFSSADGFPLDMSKAVQHVRVPIQAGRAVCEFRDVKPGFFAISAMRDNRGDGAQTWDFFDIPKGGVGASNDAKGFLGPPAFNDARFEYKGGVLHLVIRLTVGATR